MTLTLTRGKRLLLFGLITLLCFVLTSVAVGLIMALGGAADAKWMRIAAVVQDIMLFVVPPLITAVLVTRLPAKLLCIDKGVDARFLLSAVLTMVLSIPAMNFIIEWNESIQLPESMAGIERWMRASEENAREYMNMMLGGTSVMTLIVNILIVGVLAGFSEELFFRGGLQRLLTTGGISAGWSIAIVAFIFSAVHMQFYGFVPRMLLGVYFGLALVWSRSLWVPVILHALNNSIYVYGQWLSERGAFSGDESPFETVGTEEWLLPLASAIAVAAGIYTLYRFRVKESVENTDKK